MFVSWPLGVARPITDVRELAIGRCTSNNKHAMKGHYISSFDVIFSSIWHARFVGMTNPWRFADDRFFWGIWLVRFVGTTIFLKFYCVV